MLIYVEVLNFNSLDIACRKGIRLINIILTNNLTLLYFSIILQGTIVYFSFVVLALLLIDKLLNFITFFLHIASALLAS